MYNNNDKLIRQITNLNLLDIHDVSKDKTRIADSSNTCKVASTRCYSCHKWYLLIISIHYSFFARGFWEISPFPGSDRSSFVKSADLGTCLSSICCHSSNLCAIFFFSGSQVESNARSSNNYCSIDEKLISKSRSISLGFDTGILHRRYMYIYTKEPTRFLLRVR